MFWGLQVAPKGMGNVAATWLQVVVLGCAWLLSCFLMSSAFARIFVIVSLFGGAFQRVPDGAEFFLPAEEGRSLDLDQVFSSSCGPFSSLRSGLYFRDDCRNQCFQRVWFLLGGLVVTALLPSILLHSSFLATTTRLRAIVAR